ncbi:zf-HC2 domain-containing protein [Micromonospora sp. CPCC 205371]|nr:zf-HC2 domain-containing protein [Micromonospora sp. CPCC 205371]
MPDEHCVHPDVGAYALGLLEPDERARYELHLRGCARCSRAVRSLAPLVELLGAVDARSLLAATEPPVPPTPLRIPAPRIADSPVTPRPVTPPAEPAPTRWERHSHALRCLTIAAAASTVLVLVGFVTFAARSSVQEPPMAAGTTTVEAVPPGAADPTPSRPHPSTRPRPPAQTVAPTTPPPAETRPPATTAPPVEEEPDTLSAVGPPPVSDRHVAHNPETGAHATVETTEADTGTVRTDMTVALTKVDGPREGVVTVTTTTGETTVATKWQISEGGDGSTVWASAPVGAGEIARIDVVDHTGTVLVSVPVNPVNSR